MLLLKRVSRLYRTMSREEYRENQKLAMMSTKVERLEMPHLLAPDGGPNPQEEEVILHSVPEVQINYETQSHEPYHSTLLEYKPDLVFLQYNPMHYLARQRYVGHQCAMRGEDEFHEKATYQFDNPIPLNWDECVVNLITLDHARLNKNSSNLTLTKSLATFSYETLQAYEDHQANIEPFIGAIQDHVAGNEWSKYIYMNQLLYLALMGKSRVVLGDMPEPLLRIQLGNQVPLDTVKEIYAFVINKMQEHYSNPNLTPITMEECTMTYFPHIFQMPRDLYVTAMLKESFKAAERTVAFVGAPHFYPLQRYWVGPPAGVNYTQATYVPPRIKGETDEMLIEKQAIFDLLLDTKLWSAKYLTNPFPYLSDSITDFSKQDFQYFKQHFFNMTQKHQQMRDKILTITPEMIEKGTTTAGREKLSK